MVKLILIKVITFIHAQTSKLSHFELKKAVFPSLLDNFYVGPPKESIFVTTIVVYFRPAFGCCVEPKYIFFSRFSTFFDHFKSMVYFSVIITHIVNYIFLYDVDLLWAAFHVLHQHLSF